VIVLAGLKFGIFTPTEAAVVAAVYALFVATVIYRELKPAQLYEVFASAAKTTAVIMFLVAAAMVSAWLITVADLPGKMVDLLQPLMEHKTLLLLAIMVLLIAIGTALDMTPTILIMSPVLMPVVKAAGIDPVYFGVLFIMNCAIGLITPPVGVVLNVLVLGVTNFLFQQWLSKDAVNVNNPGTLDLIRIPFLSDVPLLGPILFENRITVFLAFLIVPVIWYVLFRTRLGLRARAVGEHPLAADTVGVDVGRTRFWWVVLGGSLAGLGGAALTIGSAGGFGREMSGGLGFIALAVMILGRWHPVYASLAALLFGFSIILRVWANQVSPGIPSDFITMVPYIVTVIAVVGFVGKSRPPKALAIPYVKGQ
jgi:ABC-type uncharacterized transport system permease subunit